MFVQQYDGKKIRQAILMYNRIRSYRKVGEFLGIGKSTIHRWYNRFHMILNTNKRSNVRMKRKRWTKFPQLKEHLSALFQNIDTVKFMTLENIRQALPEDNKRPSLSTLSMALRGKQVHVSRRRFGGVFRICGKESEERKQYIATFKQTFRSLPLNSIACLDETGFCNIGNAFYGYFSKGVKPKQLSTQKRLRKSCLMAITTSGVALYHLQDKAFGKETFCMFLKELMPLLDPCVKTILMDNIRFHHNKEALNIITSSGRQPLFIPPYSPQFNPIEQAFSHLKRSFRYSLTQGTPFQDAVYESIKYLGNRGDLTSSYQGSLNECHK